MMKQKLQPPTKPTIRQPPIMMSDMGKFADKNGVFKGDILNVYCTLSEACDMTGWSDTMIRKLVNGKVLRQEFHGIYRIADLCQCASDYHTYGKGKEVVQRGYREDEE
jgi:hypothetical protein